MVDIGASVLAKLRNKAKETGRSNQLCMQLFCQEEFLRRLEKSKYSENFVLKGGLFLYTLTDFDSRVTVDVDFMLRKIPNTPEKLRTVIEEIISADKTNDFVTFEVKDISQISVNKQYPGIHVDIVAKIKNTRTPFGIDFGIGDIIVPSAIKRKLPTQLSEFDSPIVNTYSIETTIAEKIDAILSLMEFSSRMKDYYDIYYLANKFDFDGEMLVKAMNTTFKNRKHSFTTEQFNQIMSSDTDNAMKKKWNAFCKKIQIENDFKIILKTIKDFLSLPYKALLDEVRFDKKWLSSSQRWI